MVAVMSEDKFTQTNKVIKSNGAYQIIGGWATEFDVWDSDEERINIDSYEKSVVDFCKDARSFNVNHKGPTVGTLIDSLFLGSEDFAKQLVSEITGMDEADIPIKKIGHFFSVQLQDKELFDQVVEEGAMFSIEGMCNRTIVEDED